MARRGLQGADETSALFDALPSAARYELADTLGRIGRDVLAEQLARTPRRTGQLASQEEVQLLTDQLRVRVGLVGPASKAKFYGRVVNSGRSAQTVLVQRRRVGAPIRPGRKQARDIAATYSLRVTALPARPFIDLPEGNLDAIVAQRLADFWSGVLDRAGA